MKKINAAWALPVAAFCIYVVAYYADLPNDITTGVLPGGDVIKLTLWLILAFGFAFYGLISLVNGER